jgi:hypothetical protein
LLENNLPRFSLGRKRYINRQLKRNVRISDTVDRSYAFMPEGDAHYVYLGSLPPEVDRVTGKDGEVNAGVDLRRPDSSRCWYRTTDNHTSLVRIRLAMG